MAIYLTEKLPTAVRMQEKGLSIAFGVKENALRILIFNLMSTVERTEEDILEKLALSDIDIQVTFLHTESWTYERVPLGHYEKYYRTFSGIKDLFFDGLIATGAPVLPSTENAFWEEYRAIYLWARTHTKSQFHICWAAFAAVMQQYHAELVWYDEKYFGVFPTKIEHQSEPIFHSLEDGFESYASREIGLDPEFIKRQEKNGLLVLAEYEGKGPALMKEKDSPVFYSLCHFDYNAWTLHHEYRRDISRGMAMHIPENYYRDNDAHGEIKKSALVNSFLVFGNWLKFYVQG